MRSDVVLAADGTPISIHTHGDGGGPTVLLTNGIGTTANFWRFLIADLKTDYTVVHWDYRGHGQTPVATSGDYTLHTHADDLARVTRHVMKREGRPPVHVAFSMGVACCSSCIGVNPSSFARWRSSQEPPTRRAPAPGCSALRGVSRRFVRPWRSVRPSCRSLRRS